MSRLDNLAVYLSDGCNLACGYCYVAVNRAPASRLTLKQVRRAIDEFCGAVPPSDRKITFLGGEPLLDWSLFVGAARYARRRGGPDIILQTFTNGTLLTPEKVAVMSRLGVHCTVSLDGTKADNDRRRRYRASGRSVYDAVMARLMPLDKSALGVALVVTAETVDHLLANLEALRVMGFRRITFSPDLYGAWPEEKLRTARRVMSGVARWYKSLLESGRAPQMPVLFAVLRRLGGNAAGERWWRGCHSMVLGPDAHYYSCDKALSFPVGQASGLRVGSAGTGMDWNARRGQLDEFAGWIERFGRSSEFACPIGAVAHARQSGRDPARELDSFRRVAEAFGEGFAEIVALCRAHPAFEDMYGRSRIKSNDDDR